MIQGVHVTIVTAPVYKPNTAYSLFDYNVTDQTKQTSIVKSDSTGRLHFNTDGKYHQFGVSQKKVVLSWFCVAYKVNDSSIFLPHRQPAKLKLYLLNKGGAL